MAYIYCITNVINNKRYVGKTTLTLEKRFKEHCRDSLREKYNKRPLYDAMNKYGIENFIIEELEHVDDVSLLNEKECYWIQELQTYGSNGYNATKGGDGKILYDYKEIIELANLGYTYNQISEKIGCCKDIIHKVLKSSGTKIKKENSQLIAQFDLAGNYIQTFFGSGDAAMWLIEHGKTISKGASSPILKCCKGYRKTAYGYIWKFIEQIT